jgi:hypothetical protein
MIGVYTAPGFEFFLLAVSLFLYDQDTDSDSKLEFESAA